MNLLGIVVLIPLMVVVLYASHRFAVLGILAGVLYLTSGQAIDFFGFNLFAFRFLEIAGGIRILVRSELSLLKLNRIDKTLLLLYLYTTVVYILRSSEGIAYQIGLLVDTMLVYFIFRSLISNIQDVKWVLKAFVVILIPYVAIVSIERFAGRNLFSYMGGVLENYYVRDGIARCMGSFRHPSLFGTLGASLLPLYIGLGFSKSDKPFSIIGICIAILIVLLSNSGGPASSFLIGIIGWAFWPIRKDMVWVRRGIVLILIILAIFMNAPIWFLPARISSITGGDGWHRSFLIDVAIQHIDQWWLCGMPIIETQDWFEYTLTTPGGADITNQYLKFGISSGVIAIFLFIFLLKNAYGTIGNAMAVVPKTVHNQALLWAIGVCLTVHVITWLGISYFDQFYAVWLMQLSLISGIINPVGEGNNFHQNSNVAIVNPFKLNSSKLASSSSGC